MKRRVFAFLAVLTAMFTMSTTALAFDCMRVSSSLKGLQQSTAHGGNWFLFDMTDGGGGVLAVLEIFGGLNPTVAQQALPCFQSAYDAAVANPDQVPPVPQYFALGVGVAGAHAGHGPEVIAHRAPAKVLMNGTGIDHLDDTVLQVLGAAAPTCLP